MVTKGKRGAADGLSLLWELPKVPEGTGAGGTYRYLEPSESNRRSTGTVGLGTLVPGQRPFCFQQWSRVRMTVRSPQLALFARYR